MIDGVWFCMKKLLISLILVFAFSSAAFADRCISGDCFDGYGTYVWTTGKYAGDKYVGENKNNILHGQGTYYYANGDKYVGEYKDGHQHGQGIYTWANGDIYVGENKNDLSHGHGTLTYVSGDKYVGEFKDGYKHGQGIEINADGSIYHNGEWKNDEPVFWSKSFGKYTNISWLKNQDSHAAYVRN